MSVATAFRPIRRATRAYLAASPPRAIPSKTTLTRWLDCAFPTNLRL
jgi:hypothetical protein